MRKIIFLIATIVVLVRAEFIVEDIESTKEISQFAQIKGDKDFVVMLLTSDGQLNNYGGQETNKEDIEKNTTPAIDKKLWSSLFGMAVSQMNF